MVGKGIDMEALSPRDANARRPRTNVADLKTKAAAQLKVNKDKEHPPPPPPNVTEPPSADRKDGAVYQVGKLLGKGGFAVCYSGVLAGTKKLYALKIVKSKMPTKMEQKFQTELQIHSKMRQVNIVQFFRAFSFESSTYLVLELCPNGSLMDMVKRRKGVTEPEVRFYAVQIAGAIKYMHAKGIIHRDLKMGNIFLDKNMNAKIGDFGLAALLVTGRDMQTIRRTTLCGTPNYIAPEILEKGKKGHDHMVDIWSLGIIMFAMLTSKPPFQSSTTDEIYRRAKERDYEWPTADGRFISEEAKHVVASMLQEAHMRPDPDAIVEHPFFVTGYMPTPADMTVRLRELPPEHDVFYQHPVSRRIQAQSLETLKEMCDTCNVGPWNPAKIVSKPVWREMAAEEQAGLTPAIPLSDDIVYRPFESWLQENQLFQGGSSTSANTNSRYGTHQKQQLQPTTSSSTPSLSVPAQPPLAEWSTQTATVVANAMEASAKRSAAATLSMAPASLLREPPQSFAAQQRAQGRPTRSSGLAETAQIASGTTTITSTATTATLPTSTSAATVSETPVPGLVRRPSGRRDIPLGNGLSLQAREQRAAATKSTSTTTTTTGRSRTLLPGSKPSATVSAIEKRASARSAAMATAESAPTIGAGAALSATKTTSREELAPGVERLSLFNPKEIHERIPNSEPDTVLLRLRKLQTELDRALNARTMAFISPTRDKAHATPPQIVVKWVDYTNKFGLGYILNDGSIGCILRSIPVESSNTAIEGNKDSGNLPPACLLIHGAERHILRREDPSYADRYQIVPMASSGNEGIYFYENNGEQGLERVRVDPQRFRVAVNPHTGVAGKLSAGKDVYDHRKRECIVLWKKFANYMLAYGRELDGGIDERANDHARKTAATAAVDNSIVPSDVVTFYQRFGDVGCWVFCDGHLQFNFPDHTKVVLDAAGVWCHFWHLPAEAAQRMAATGLLEEVALDERSVLSYPLQTLLNFGVGSSGSSSAASLSGGAATSSSRRRPVIRPEIQGIPAANDFRRKVEFVRSVVREWVNNGGMGNSDMSRARRLRWTGTRETLKQVPGTTTPTAIPAAKHVWVTIGARQGDVRLSAMVDPRRPNEIGPDLEEKR
ncbi:PLK protein kinase [Sporothrix schenckii ATCC 58251]|uniref:PLK protein kinase n=1 Tax=Sporothrix schenckii (strain ATCC 58251 / de Perez 2211183) TaxID=1391915 RepID=U7Q654_SPOS1|nr:PLK protein kinase [Sporothrix schenckii ATCC 58251]